MSWTPEDDQRHFTNQHSRFDIINQRITASHGVNGLNKSDRARVMARKRQNYPISILFIGNSFTQRNNLPGLLTELAAARDLCIRHKLISVGGASLRTHWNAGRASAAIAADHYDYVVLQEQSTLPVKNAQRMAENIRLFDQAIRQADSQTVLYMTWARQNAPGTQQAISDAYNTIGNELGATVVPVGLAWQSFVSTCDEPVLYDRDQSHPSLAGSYLAACVFLSVLLHVNPIGIEAGPAGLEPHARAKLQRVAWKQIDSRK